MRENDIESSEISLLEIIRNLRNRNIQNLLEVIQKKCSVWEKGLEFLKKELDNEVKKHKK